MSRTPTAFPQERQAPCIAYVARVLPTLSETFVIREIAALRRMGAAVRLFSLYAPDPTGVHPELPHAARESLVLFAPFSFRFWLAHFYFALFHPLRYLACLRLCLFTPGESLPRRLRALSHFLMAPHAAWQARQNGITHLHAHFANTAATVALMASRLAGIPFSFMAHAYDIFLDDTLMAPKLTSARFAAACSRFHVRYLQEHYPEASSQAHFEVVHYGIDPDRFPFTPPQAGDDATILAVGRLVETKGFHTLVEACGLLKRRGQRIRCLLVGEGPEERRLKDLVSLWHVEEEFHFMGRLQPAETAACYRRATLFVMPSCVRRNDRDGMPNVLLEAMATGIPVISTRVSGIPELVRHEETGLLVEPDDGEALAQAIQRLLGDRRLREKLAGTAREVILREFDISGSARRLLRLFQNSSEAA